MICTQCGFENSLSAKFCQECGVAIQLVAQNVDNQNNVHLNSGSQNEDTVSVPGQTGEVLGQTLQPLPNGKGETGAVVPIELPLKPQALQVGGISGQPVIAMLRPRGYAGFWKRLIANAIDGLILNFLTGLFGGSVYRVIEPPQNLPNLGFSGISIVGNGVAASLLGWLVIPLLYYALFESSAKQATLGKMMLGIRVTDLNFERVSFGKAVVRFVVSFISQAILGLGYLMMLFTERHQTLHDLAAGTLVVE